MKKSKIYLKTALYEVYFSKHQQILLKTGSWIMFHHNDTANVWFCTLFPLKNRGKDETDRFFCIFFKKIRKKVKFWFDIIQTWCIIIAFVVLWRWISTTECAYVAQLVEHFLGKEEVIGSTPIIGSMIWIVEKNWT